MGGNGSKPLPVGVLALQGDYELHQRMLARLDAPSLQVRKAAQLASVGALIIPGGESTTMLKLMTEEGLMEPVKRFHEDGGAIYGTCAGAILLAKRVVSPEQESLALLDIDIERNGYGRQLDSHESFESCEALGPEPLPMVFIRAPVILRVGPSVTKLASHRGQPVFVRDGSILVSTFHPELSDDLRVHRYFLEEVAEATRG